MTQEQLDAICSRCEHETPDAASPVFRDRKALLAEVDTLRNAIKIAAEERGTPMAGWDAKKVMDRWIKKAEGMK